MSIASSERDSIDLNTDCLYGIVTFTPLKPNILREWSASLIFSCLMSNTIYLELRFNLLKIKFIKRGERVCSTGCPNSPVNFVEVLISIVSTPAYDHIEVLRFCHYHSYVLAYVLANQ